MSTEPLRVLFITHTFPRSSSGPQSDSLNLLADALAVQGVEVRVVAPDMHSGKGKGGEGDSAGTSAGDTGAREDDARVERFRVARPRARAASTASAPQSEAPIGKLAPPARSSRSTALNFLGAGFGSAVKVRRDFKPDVVHAHWWFPSGLVGSWVSSLASLPLVTSLHGFDESSGRAGSPTRPLFRHVLKRSAAITVESNAEVHRLASVLDGVSPIIVPLPLAVDVFRPSDSKRNSVALVVGPETARDELPALLRSFASGGLEVTLIRNSDSDHSTSAGALGARVAVVSATDRSALVRVLGEARACVVVGASEEHRATVSAAMLAGAPPAFIQGPPPHNVLSEHFRVALQLQGTAVEERAASLRTVLADADSLKAQADAARMYAMSALAPESCAARMLGAYLRALDDAAA